MVPALNLIHPHEHSVQSAVLPRLYLEVLVKNDRGSETYSCEDPRKIRGSLRNQMSKWSIARPLVYVKGLPAEHTFYLLLQT